MRVKRTISGVHEALLLAGIGLIGLAVMVLTITVCTIPVPNYAATAIAWVAIVGELMIVFSSDAGRVADRYVLKHQDDPHQ
ncbi:MAG: hypothetical protein LBM73_02095 [Candidatus Nomurabacteria bacterium]|nr:hypothetical protein [Candidatus Nomurabacteria bacterium]